MDYYAIDFETANENTTSACSIGIIGVKNGKILLEEHHYINPEEEFNDYNISIHHITPLDVKHSLNFRMLWPKIYKYFDNTIIVAHNASFDVGVLKACIEKYNLSYPNFKYACTVKICKEIFTEGFPNHKLSTMSEYLQVDHKHHDALSDSRVCVYIINRALKITQSNTLEELYYSLGYSFGKYSSSRFFNTYKTGARIFNNEMFILSDILDKVFYFTGSSKKKKLLINSIQLKGGIVEKKFRDNCDYLVILDTPDKNYIIESKKKDYIKIINEKQLEEMVMR